MDEYNENENKFPTEEASALAQEALEQVLGGVSFQSSKTEAWSNQIVETTLGKLAGLEKAFKYCVTVTLMQKTGAGLHAASSCYDKFS